MCSCRATSFNCSQESGSGSEDLGEGADGMEEEEEGAGGLGLDGAPVRWGSAQEAVAGMKVLKAKPHAPFQVRMELQGWDTAWFVLGGGALRV